MSCNTTKVTQGYLEGGDPVELNIGCIPSGIGKPTTPPNQDQIPFKYDEKGEDLYYYMCETQEWNKVDTNIADLNPVDIDVLADPENNLNIPVVYEVGGVKVEGLLPFSELIEIIQDLNKTNPVTNLELVDNQFTVTYLDGTEEPIDLPKFVTSIEKDDDKLIVTDSTGEEKELQMGYISDVRREGDTIVIEEGGRIFRVSIASLPAERPISFDINGDNVEITLADGTVLDLTRQEFADWLASEDSPLATDEELLDLANDIRNDIGNLQDQIDDLQNQLNAINTDQAVLSKTNTHLVLTNEDGTSSRIALADLIPANTTIRSPILDNPTITGGLTLDADALEDFCNLVMSCVPVTYPDPTLTTTDTGTATGNVTFTDTDPAQDGATVEVTQTIKYGDNCASTETQTQTATITDTTATTSFTRPSAIAADQVCEITYTATNQSNGDSKSVTVDGPHDGTVVTYPDPTLTTTDTGTATDNVTFTDTDPAQDGSTVRIVQTIKYGDNCASTETQTQTATITDTTATTSFTRPSAIAADQVCEITYTATNQSNGDSKSVTVDGPHDGTTSIDGYEFTVDKPNANGSYANLTIDKYTDTSPMKVYRVVSGVPTLISSDDSYVIEGDYGIGESVKYIVVSDAYAIRLRASESVDTMSIDVTKFYSKQGRYTYNVEQELTVPDQLPSYIKSMAGMFYGSTMFNQDISSWDVSRIKDMSGAFNGAISFNQDISSWDVSNVTNMNSMFSGASSFNQPLNNWDISNVTTTHSMFSDASSFNQPLNNWNTSSVDDMSSMFSGASSFNQPLNNWNTSSVDNMTSMFKNATSFNQPLNSWDTSVVTNMSRMFNNATSFDQPLNNWNTSSVVDNNLPLNENGPYGMREMFDKATSFNQDLSQWCVENLTTEPFEFNVGTPQWTLPKPNWGAPC